MKSMKFILLALTVIALIAVAFLLLRYKKILASFYSINSDEYVLSELSNDLVPSGLYEDDFDLESLSYIDDFIESEIDKGFPGAVLLVMKDGKIVKHSAYGYKLKYESGKELVNPVAMTKDTLFDLASNTKIYATTLAIIKLVDEGKIELNDPVEKYLPNFKDNENDPIKMKKYVTISHLLNHVQVCLQILNFIILNMQKYYSIEKNKQ